MTRWQQFWCGLRGHTSVLAFEGARMLLRCTSCGHDSPGLSVCGRGPRRTYEADAAKLALCRWPRPALRRVA